MPSLLRSPHFPDARGRLLESAPLEAGVRRAGQEVALGFRRLQTLAPGLLRLLRYRSLGALRRSGSARWPRRLLSLVLLSALSSSCGFLGGEGEGDWGALSPISPELSRKQRAETQPGSFSYVLPVDHGVRVDASGKGHFRAPRTHGEHNGLDLLAPVGTPVFAACSGPALRSVSRSFGHWVRVICPVPEALRAPGAPIPWVSFFYAHLESSDLPFDDWQEVESGQPVGTVGKSGNARGPEVQPHLHLELIVQRNRRSAMDERHLGRDQSGVEAADFVAVSLQRSCLEPDGFGPRSQLIQRARRLDPFVFLTCLTPGKPRFVRAPSPLDAASNAWSQYYVARSFNVNSGRSALR